MKESFEEWFERLYKKNMYPHAWGPLEIPCLNAWNFQKEKVDQLLKENDGLKNDVKHL